MSWVTAEKTRSWASALALFLAAGAGASVAEAQSEFSDSPALSARAKAGDFSPAGLYHPRVHELDNGLRLVLRPREGIPSVSIRIAVDLGSADYPCGRQQVPHFLEHMLFAGVPGMSEADFERRVRGLGGSSNAWTGREDTVYELDVYSGYLEQGLSLMADLVTLAQLDAESHRATARVIAREVGGAPSTLESQTFAGGRLASGATQAVADVAGTALGFCGERDLGDSVTLEEVRQAYARYYGPERMTWVLVGEFDPEAVIAWAEQRLGGVAPVGALDPLAASPGEFSQSVYRGYGEEPGVGVLATTDGFTDADHYAHELLLDILRGRLYDALRVETPLTYTPSVETYNLESFGLVGITVEAHEADHGLVRDLLGQELDVLRETPMDPAAFQEAQRSLLLRWSQSLETNAGYANYYVKSLHELQSGEFINEEYAVAQLTPQALQSAARTLFSARKMAWIEDSDRETAIERWLESD